MRLNRITRIIAFVLAILLTIAFSAAALYMCRLSFTKGTLYLATSGDPSRTVRQFMDCVSDGNYDLACAYLDNYSSLGDGTTKEDPDTSALIACLRDSCSYKLVGECAADGLSARQRVAFTCLCPSMMKDDLKERVNSITAERVLVLPAGEVYDADKNYLKSFTDVIYHEALEDVLKNKENYYSEAEFDVDLLYRDGEWKVIMPPELLSLLRGESIR